MHPDLVDGTVPGAQPMRWRALAALLLAVGLAAAGATRAATTATVQRGARIVQPEPNVPYDGRFTFARIRYTRLSAQRLGVRLSGHGAQPDGHHSTS